MLTAITLLLLNASSRTMAETKVVPDQISLVGSVDTGGIGHDPKGALIYGLNSYLGFNYSYGGYFSASGTGGIGVYGYSAGASGMGVYGRAIDGNGWAVYGDASGTSGRGVYGYASNIADGTKYGGYFAAEGRNGRGARCEASGQNGIGLYGRANGTGGTGVYGKGLLYDFYAGGAGINYAPFTGAHEVKIEPNMPSLILPGMIVSVTGDTAARKEDSRISISSTLPTVTLSNITKDRAVLGAFVTESALPKGHWYEGEQGERFGVVNAVGEGRVWVTDRNGEIRAGDYITSSDIPGYGQLQEDDLLHSYTVGKAIETIDWHQVSQVVEHKGETYKAYLMAVVYTGG